MITKEELQDKLENCYCTDNYYAYKLYGVKHIFNYTDGVLTFVRNAEAYWFLDMVASYVGKLKENYMSTIRLTVENNKATFSIYNDDDKEVAKQNIPFTDCPDGEYRFYMFWKDYDMPVMIWYREY